jgi:hypothetical protein
VLTIDADFSSSQGAAMTDLLSRSSSPVTINSIAACAHIYWARGQFGLKIGSLLTAGLLTACAGIGTSIGVSVPIGRMGGVGVSIGSGGTVSGSVGVGSGGGSVSVGASGQLPKPAEQKPEVEPEKKEEKKP